jgi:hypothetical protein
MLVDPCNKKCLWDTSKNRLCVMVGRASLVMLSVLKHQGYKQVLHKSSRYNCCVVRVVPDFREGQAV